MQNIKDKTIQWNYVTTYTATNWNPRDIVNRACHAAEWYRQLAPLCCVTCPWPWHGLVSGLVENGTELWTSKTWGFHFPASWSKHSYLFKTGSPAGSDGHSCLLSRCVKTVFVFKLCHAFEMYNKQTVNKEVHLVFLLEVQSISSVKKALKQYDIIICTPPPWDPRIWVQLQSWAA
jgi:hypothetical protein